MGELGDREVRAIRLRGAGRAFCAGYDIGWGAGWMADQEAGRPWDPIAHYQRISRFVDAYTALWRSPKPVIAQVHGFCVGGGTDFALCSDLIVCADDARIGYSPARVWGSPTTARLAARRRRPPHARGHRVPPAGGGGRPRRRQGPRRAVRRLRPTRQVSEAWGVEGHIDTQGPTRPLGVVLAGGRGSRMGGGKAVVAFRGRPLIAWPLAAMRAVLEEVVVVAKRGTALPGLDVPVLFEPDEPFHPAVGLNRALEEGRDIVVCAADLPHVTPAVFAELASQDGAAVTRAAGPIQPLLARYPAPTRFPFDEPLTAVATRLRPTVLRVAPNVLHNVNTPGDLLA